MLFALNGFIVRLGLIACHSEESYFSRCTCRFRDNIPCKEFQCTPEIIDCSPTDVIVADQMDWTAQSVDLLSPLKAGNAIVFERHEPRQVLILLQSKHGFVIVL